MKTFKTVFIAIALLIGITSSAAVIYTGWEIGAKKLADNSTVELYSSAFDRNGLNVVKFKDDNTVCYISYSKVGSNVATNSIACNIK